MDHLQKQRIIIGLLCLAIVAGMATWIEGAARHVFGKQVQAGTIRIEAAMRGVSYWPWTRGDGSTDHVLAGRIVATTGGAE